MKDRKTGKRKSARSGYPKMPKVSPISRPESMDMQQWQKTLRRQGAAAPELTVVPSEEEPGGFDVFNHKRHTCNRVRFYGIGNRYNSCTCMDFRTNRLGTCKHLELVAEKMRGSRKVVDADSVSTPLIYVDYSGGRTVRFRVGSAKADLFQRFQYKWFDSKGVLVPRRFGRINDIIEEGKKLNPEFRIDPDALAYIAECNDASRRLKIEKGMTDGDVSSLVRNVSLYPYQIEGIRKAFRAGNVIIADEMGLGKTVQAIATAELFRRQGMIENVLVVCPTSLKYQWMREIDRFTGEKTEVVEGNLTVRCRLHKEKRSFFTVTSFHSLANDLKAMGSLHYDMVIIDEVQRLKNWDTKMSRMLRRLDSDYAVVLSGTPLENKIEELYSVMEFVDPYCLGPYHDFMDHTVVRSETGKVTGYKNLNTVGRLIEQRMIRRRKADVALQMPERTDTVRYVTMTDQQREMHDESQSIVAQLVFKWQRLKFLSDKDRNRLLLELSKMRMVCDSTFILDQQSRFDTKVEECIDIIQSAIEGNDTKVVVFSQWERMARLIAAELQKNDIGFEYLHGGVPSAKRGEMMNNFNSNPDIRVFLSTDAGSTGLNLQTASLLINIDLPWNPAVLEQRIARIYRLGQKRNVQVINLVAANTIEERMLSTLNFKASLFGRILDKGEDSITLSDSNLTKIAQTISPIEAETDEKEPEFSPQESTSKQKTESESSTESPAARSSQQPPCQESEPTPAASATSTASKASTASAPSTSQTPEELIGNGVKFLSGLAETLRSPEATARLVDTLVKTDPATGTSTLQIPVPDKETVASALSLFASLLNSSKK